MNHIEISPYAHYVVMSKRYSQNELANNSSFRPYTPWILSKGVKVWQFLKLLIEANVMVFSFFRHDQSNGVRNFDEVQIGLMFIIIITTTSTTFIIIHCHHHFLHKSLLICASPLLIGLLIIYWCYPYMLPSALIFFILS